MYSKFNVSVSGWKDKNYEAKLLASGKTIREKNNIAVRESLDKFLNEDESLDGTSIQNHWFPQIAADVFISHSHSDEDLALSFAGWLSERGLEPFVDSCVWGYSDNLLKQIDDRYCTKGEHLYSYEKRNGSTSHIHMMLSTALSKMMDTTEAVMLLNTEKAITTEESIEKTKSPWIYYEMATLGVLRRRKKNLHRKMQKVAKAIVENFSIHANEQIPMEYELDLSHLVHLDGDTCNKWMELVSEQKWNHPLDALYSIIPDYQEE